MRILADQNKREVQKKVLFVERRLSLISSIMNSKI